MPPKKAQIAEIPDDESDDQLEFIASKSVSNQGKTSNIHAEQELPHVAQPYAIKEKKPKQKRQVSEEQKKVLMERLQVAHQRKQELAAARRAVKQEEEENHLAQKQLRILEQARLIKQRQKSELKAIDQTPTEPIKKEKKKKQVVVYVDDEDESSEEEIIIKPKKKQAKSSQQQQQQTPQQIPQQIQNNHHNFNLNSCNNVCKMLEIIVLCSIFAISIVYIYVLCIHTL
jgi:exonuclease VII large subunit